MPMQEFDPSEFNPPILIYGENGIGKTHLACTCPGRKAFIDYHGNVHVVKKFPNEPIKCLRGPETWKTMQEMWTDSIFDNFDVVILDNMTGMYRVIVEDVVKNVPLKSAEGYRPSPETPILRDYNLASERLRVAVGTGLIKKLGKERGKRIIAISHTKVEKDEETGNLIGGPSLPGQVPAYVLSLFPETIYLKMEGGDRVAKLRHTGLFPATSRILDDEAIKNGIKLGQGTAPPNLASIYK